MSAGRIHRKQQWGWTADGIQFIRVSSPSNATVGNRCLNEPGRSYLTDFINVYCSPGTRDSALLVASNILVGAGRGGLYNQYGCGIQLNDHSAHEDGGEFVDAVGNVLVDPGIVGININGGYRTRVLGNTILMANVHRTNLRRGPAREHPAWAAVTLFNYSGGISRDSGHEVRGNRVAFRQPGGTPFINKTQPRDPVIESNDWSASFDLRDLLGRQSP